MTPRSIIYAINIFFLIYMFFYTITFFVTTFISSFTLDDFSARKEFYGSNHPSNEINYIPISIIVPAHNESITIIDSIKSLLELDYPIYEIIIVNDGSTDDTLNIVKNYFDLKKVNMPYRRLVPSQPSLSIFQNETKAKITLADKVNGGKSDALNLGINISGYPMFLCVDADSVIKKDALKKIIQPFLEDDNTVAVGGNIKISNGMTFKDGEVETIKEVNCKLPKNRVLARLS